MTRHLCDLPCRQLGEDTLRQRIPLRRQSGDFLADVDLGIIGDVPEFVDLGFELSDRLFEFEKLEIHAIGAAIVRKAPQPG